MDGRTTAFLYLAMSFVLAGRLEPRQAASAKPPVAPVRLVTDDYFGTKVVDNHRWMGNLKDPEDQTWFKNQDGYTRTRLASIPGRDTVLARLRERFTSVSTIITDVQRLPRDRCFYQNLRPGDRVRKLYKHEPPAMPRVQVTPNEMARRVDVTVDGKPFTSYIWPERLTKPVLYPIRGATGTLVTRGWPMDPRPRERVDHPHQVGLWFTYESVDGVDFWGNSDALTPDEAARKGTIAHRRIVSTTSGVGHGTLVTEMDWILPDGRTALRERAEFVFSADASSRTIDQTTALTALDEPVVFADAKDGLFGMRVTRELEQPGTRPTVHTDASGLVSTEKTVDNDGVTGSYTSSEGKQGDEVWGTRGRWMMLSGRVGNEPITIAMIDHPTNPGYPTYWHARGYGLFAANPLGAKAFSNGKDAMNFTIAPHASATFRYRLLILEGAASPDRVEKEFRDFSKVRPSRPPPE